VVKKELGNKLFEQKQFTKAIEAYTAAIVSVSFDDRPGYLTPTGQSPLSRSARSQHRYLAKIFTII
jgi:hypothetical protein